MGRFTLKQLLIVMVPLAVGMAMLLPTINHSEDREETCRLWVLSGIAIGGTIGGVLGGLSKLAQ
jgi:hypothetical protein